MTERYSKKHDAFFDVEKDVWLESACDSPHCEFCFNRPERPSQVMKENKPIKALIGKPVVI